MRQRCHNSRRSPILISARQQDALTTMARVHYRHWSGHYFRATSELRDGAVNRFGLWYSVDVPRDSTWPQELFAFVNRFLRSGVREFIKGG